MRLSTGVGRYLTHETSHAVYVIGNQDLAEEAAIQGVVDIVGHLDSVTPGSLVTLRC